MSKLWTVYWSYTVRVPVSLNHNILKIHTLRGLCVVSLRQFPHQCGYVDEK